MAISSLDQMAGVCSSISRLPRLVGWDRVLQIFLAADAAALLARRAGALQTATDETAA
jgi:hypothetical protein